MIASGAAIAVSLRPKSPRAQAADELQRVVAEPRARAFYEGLGWRLAWSPDQRVALEAALARSVDHGMETGGLDSLVAAATSAAARDAALTQAAFLYADALAQGMADPNAVNAVYTLPRNPPVAGADLRQALEEGRLGPWLEGLTPQDDAYRSLSAAYRHFRAQLGAPFTEIDAGAVLRLGMTDPRLPAVRRRLTDLGYPSAFPAGLAALYDADLAAQVRAFQRDVGLADDGVIGPDTLGALNSGPADRARRIALNMERLRWLERPAAATRIDVNTAAAMLSYYRDGELALYDRVVVGRPDWATPALAASFDQLVVNPPWSVPRSIARREILPRGAAYRRRHNMILRGGRVIQRPGPESALGLVKFDMRNRFAIYLHDTPVKATFELAERHRSHGCVRVRDAVGFARRLADERGRGQAFEAALASGRTTRVRLGAPIPVRLLYQTAFVDQGQVRFAPDVYARDSALAEALGMPPMKGPSRQRFAEIPLGP